MEPALIESMDSTAAAHRNLLGIDATQVSSTQAQHRHKHRDQSNLILSLAFLNVCLGSVAWAWDVIMPLGHFHCRNRCHIFSNLLFRL